MSIFSIVWLIQTKCRIRNIEQRMSIQDVEKEKGQGKKNPPFMKGDLRELTQQ